MYRQRGSRDLHGVNDGIDGARYDDDDDDDDDDGFIITCQSKSGHMTLTPVPPVV